MNINSQNEQQRQEAVLEQLDRTTLLTLVKQMIQLHPDLSQLIDSLSTTHKLHYEPLNAELYRLKVEQIFSSTDRNSWGSEGRAAGPLLDIMKIAEAAAQKQDYTNAVLLYEIIVRGIFDNYDTFRWHADEGDLDTVIEACADGLDKCLREVQQKNSERTHIIQILCDIYEFDMTLDNDEPVMSSKVPVMLIQHTTSAERKNIAARIRQAFELEIDWHTDEISELYDRWVELLLGLEAETIDDETFLRICRETENYPYLIERLLKLGRPEEALAEAQQIDTYYLPEIADIFRKQGYEEMALHLQKGFKKSTNISHTQE
jgi:DNA mismatch repair ATPase MutS